MYQRIVIGLLLGCCAATANAAPIVSSTSGAVVDNQVIQINGSAFGTNTSQAEWLGGTTGVIETATNGRPFLSTARTGWYEDIENNDSFVDQRRAWSGRQSLAFDPLLSRYHDQRFGLIWDTGSQFTELYSSYMVYFDAGGAVDGQWKMIRWCFTNSVQDGNTPNAYMANWAGGPGDFLQVHTGDTSSKNNWFTNQVLPLTGAWYRVETYMRPSTAPTASDGQFWVRTTRMTDALVQTQSFNDLKNYADSETRRYRYIVFQNYMGNNGYDGAPGPTKLWMDDIYISKSQARVELCASATWAQCTRRELQPTTQWSNTQISVRLNKGGLASLAGTFVYVVDSTGAVNANGIPLGAKAPAAMTDVAAH